MGQEHVEQGKRRCGRLGSGRQRSGRELRDGQKIETEGGVSFCGEFFSLHGSVSMLTDRGMLAECVVVVWCWRLCNSSRQRRRVIERW